MNFRDQKKVTDAGFTILYASENEKTIKFKDKHHPSWNHLEKGFASKAALRRRMDELLKDPMTIED